MIYVTGDKHRDFDGVEIFCERNNTTQDDVLIVLGDAGVNYYGGLHDEYLKECLSRLPITFFFIHGNHEVRPENVDVYHLVPRFGGHVYVEDKYPNLLFAYDGSLYTFDNLVCLVIGGAYSVDKYYRMVHGANWWADEQPSAAIKLRTENAIQCAGKGIDIVLSHTCPLRYIPTEKFLSDIDQSTVDQSTEIWLQHIELNLSYDKWYCGHYHCDKHIDNMRFMFNDFVELGK